MKGDVRVTAGVRARVWINARAPSTSDSADCHGAQ